MIPENLNAQWARIIVHALHSAGVRHVVASPGARSAPVLCALLDSDLIEVQMVLDERSASFLALGRARALGTPQTVLRTSGTAGGHDLPAVMEARRAGLPLLVITADRPQELVGTAASQTATQTNLLLSQTGTTVELGMPEAHPEGLRGLMRRVVQAVAATRYPHPGPVHLNVQARKPLEPRSAESPEAQGLESEVDALIARGAAKILVGDPGVPPQAESWWTTVAETSRRLVVVGPQHPATATDAPARLAEAWGCPLIAEASSQLRTRDDVRHAELSLLDGKFAAEAAPELIVQFGAPPVGKGWLSFSRRHRDVPRLAVGHPQLWLDANNGPGAQWACAPSAAAGWLQNRRPANSEVAAVYRHRFARQKERVAALLQTLLDAQDELGELHVVQAALSSAKDFVLVGNGLPIRHLETLGIPLSCAVFAQRGLNGIDGLLAQAAGVSESGRGEGVVILGDLSCRHDIASLGLLENRQVRVVVVHNGGGRIFEALPMQSTLPVEHMKRFTTPDETSLLPWAKAAGLTAIRVGTQGELSAAMQGDVQFIEAVVDPGEATRFRTLLQEALRS